MRVPDLVVEMITAQLVGGSFGVSHAGLEEVLVVGMVEGSGDSEGYSLVHEGFENLLVDVEEQLGVLREMQMLLNLGSFPCFVSKADVLGL